MNLSIITFTYRGNDLQLIKSLIMLIAKIIFFSSQAICTKQQSVTETQTCKSLIGT